MTSVTVNTYTHSVTYVSDNILKSLKDIIVQSDLDPAKLVGEWSVMQRGLRTWLESQHLERVVLEIYNPKTDALAVRWDLEISYGWSADDGNFWVDTEQLVYHMRKVGLPPSEAKYRVVLHNKPGRPDVTGWSPCEMRSTEGMVRQSIGSTVEHCGLSANASYWRKAS